MGARRALINWWIRQAGSLEAFEHAMFTMLVFGLALGFVAGWFLRGWADA